MMTAREKLIQLIAKIPEPDVEEVLYYLEHIKKQQGLEPNKEMANVGEIEIAYWDNDIDEEVLYK